MTESTESHQVRPETGIKRRSLVQGAVWSVPVVALTVSSPAYAASPATALQFVGGPFLVNACAPLSGVKVSATVDGNPAPDTPVTVTLPAGLYFTDGSSTYSGTTGADGTLALPDIVVPAGTTAGTLTMSASSGAAVTSATVTTGATDLVPGYWRSDGSPQTFPYLSVNSTPLGAGFFQAPNGDVFSPWSSTPMVTGAKQGAVHWHNEVTNTNTIAYIAPDGTARLWESRTPATDTALPAVPLNSTPLGAQFFQAPNGDVYNGGTRIITGAKPGAVFWHNELTDINTIAYIAPDGTARLWESKTPATDTALPAVPPNSTPLGAGFFQASNGDIYNAGGTPIITGARPGAAFWHNNLKNTNTLSYVDADGTARVWESGPSWPATDQGFPGVPVNSTPLGAGYFQSPTGDIYSAWSATPVVTGAEPGAVFWHSYVSNTNSFTYVIRSC